MEARNTYLDQEIKSGNDKITLEIERIPSIKQLADLKAERKVEEDKHTSIISNLDEKCTPKNLALKLVEIGDHVQHPYLDHPPKFDRPRTTNIQERKGTNPHIGVCCSNSDCGGIREIKRKPVYCACLAKEENARRTAEYQASIKVQRIALENKYAQEIKVEELRHSTASDNFSQQEQINISLLKNPNHPDVKRKIKYESTINKRSQLADIATKNKFKPLAEEKVQQLIVASALPQTPPPTNPDAHREEEKEGYGQPGFDFESKLNTSNGISNGKYKLNPNLTLPKTTKIINELLKQTHRLHHDTSWFLRSGTDKAIDIINALANLLANIEAQPNLTDDFIAEKLKEACTKPTIKSFIEGNLTEYDNPLYTALNKKRNLLGFFAPSSALAMKKLTDPPQTIDRLKSRHGWVG